MYSPPGLGRHVPLIHVLELPGHDRGPCPRHARNLAYHLVDKAQQFLGVACVDLHAEVALADGTGQVTHRGELHERSGDILELAGGHLHEHVADDGEADGLRIDDGADADDAGADEPLETVADRALGHVPDAAGDLGRGDPAVFE